MAKKVAKKGVGKKIIKKKIKSGRNNIRAGFRRKLEKKLDASGKDLDEYDAHHIFPCYFKNKFKDTGIDICNPKYGAWWKMNNHRQKASAYNKQWKNFFEVNKNPTKREIFAKAREIMKEYEEQKGIVYIIYEASHLLIT